MVKSALFGIVLVLSSHALAGDYLVKLNDSTESSINSFVEKNGGTLTLVNKEDNWYRWSSEQNFEPSWDNSVRHIQRNFKIELFQNPSIAGNEEFLRDAFEGSPETNGPAYPDNPAIKPAGQETSGADPLLSQAWGMKMIGADKTWVSTAQGSAIVVAVTDTGIDYNHADLMNNMWRNPGEIAGNGVDDDHNGFVDDIVGWDFYKQDSAPYDLSLTLMDILLKGGNPGHGTHVAGVIGARRNNKLGTVGVAPQVKLMATRFIGENGQGSTAGAIGAIDYAVNNGARVINASWGGAKGQGQEDLALKEAIQRAERKGVIFVAAAGNGKVDQKKMTAKGFDIDVEPVLPAAYDLPNVVAVAAIDSEEHIAGFSNFGKKAVKLGAPGVKVLSTVPGDRYQDTIVDMGEMKVTWDGTSMAAPFVSGSIAVLWSQDKARGYREVIQALLANTKRVADLDGKVATNGRVDLGFLGGKLKKRRPVE